MLKNLLRKKEGTASTSGVTLDPNNIPHHVAIIMDGNGTLGETPWFTAYDGTSCRC